MKQWHWIQFLGRRFWRVRQGTGLRLVGRLAVTGLALGVATLLVTQSVLAGFEKVFKETLLGFNAHLVVLKLGPTDQGGKLHQLIQEELGKDLKQITPFLYRETLLAHGGVVKGTVIKGIDPLTFSRVYAVKVRPWGQPQLTAKIEDLLKSPQGHPQVILGADLAESLGLTGEAPELKVFLPTSAADSESKALPFRRLKVVGTFETGLKEFDQGFSLMDLGQLQSWLGQPGAITGYEMRLSDPQAAEDFAQAMKRRFGFGYDAVSWQRLNAPLFQALKMERKLFFVIMALVVMVAAFNIVGVLLLMIFEKSREVSILRSLGGTYSSLKRLFAWQGLWLGIQGCLAGVLLGAAILFGLKQTQWLKLTKEVYFIEELPIELSLTVVGTVMAVSLFIAWLATRVGVARLHRSPLDL
jgi:lipoprotein-releasing system permease protein